MPSHSLQLIRPPLFSNAALRLYRHEKAGYLFASWVSVGEQQPLFEGMQALVNAVREEQIHGLLTSLEENDALAPGSMPAILNHYLPEIIKAGIRVFATVLSPRVYSLSVTEMVHASMPNELQSQTFNDALLAHSWLANNLVSV